MMNNNDLTGTLSMEIENNLALRSFSIQQNRIDGPIPSTLGTLSNLETLVRERTYSQDMYALH